MSDVKPLRSKLLGLAVVGAVVCVLGYLTGRERFFFAYLQSYMLWLGVTLGCMMIWMVHNMTGGLWGTKTIRRILESSFQLVPLMAILFIPIIVGLRVIYPWADSAADVQMLAKRSYLNVPFFVTRAVIYFVIWTALVMVFRRFRGKHPSEMPLAELHQLQRWCAAGIMLYVLTISFAGMDWMMSIEPHWFSSAFGALVLIGQILASFCFIVIVTRVLEKRAAIAPLDVKVLHDLGNFLLMSTMFWAYISFSQYLIIWSAQLPEEMFWYRARSINGWQYVAWALISLHFFVPFLVLLQRRVKKKHVYLMSTCFFLVVMRLVDLYWNGTRIDVKAGPSLHWTNLAFPLALGAIWLTGFFGVWEQAPGAPLTPAPAGLGGGSGKPVGSKGPLGGPQDRDPREKRKH